MADKPPPKDLSDYIHPNSLEYKLKLGRVPPEPQEGIIWRGMSGGEYKNLLEQGFLESKGEYNIGETQKGLTIFSSRPRTAEMYAHDFAPKDFKAVPGSSAYVVGIRKPSGAVPQTQENPSEFGVRGQIPLKDIIKVYRGNVFRPKSDKSRAVLDWQEVPVSSLSEASAYSGFEKLPAVIDAASQLAQPPADDPRSKGKGRMFRGIGSLMRGRMFPIIRAAQAGWETLSPEARAEIEDYLKRPAHELFGMDKPGIEYFKELLGISPEKIDAYHGTTAEFDAFEFLHGSGGDLGFHFGTSKQAKDRLKETTQYSPPEKRAKGKILSAELTLGKTLETPDMPSFEEWNSPRSVAKLLLGTRWGETRQKELSSIVSEANALNQKIDDIFEAEDESLLALDFWENLREMDVKGRMGLLSKVRDLMKADGYEGIKYVNEYEDPESRSYSYVVFDPANIRIKDEGETIQLPGPPQSKAAGGFIDKPLYDDQRMIG